MPWLYLGYDTARRKRIEQKLGSAFVRIHGGRMLDEVAQDLRATYVAWTDGINRQHGKDLAWWLESPASRNTYLNNTFLYCCYLVLLQKVWQDEAGRPRLIVAESPALARCISAWAKEHTIPLEVLGRASLRHARPVRYAMPVLRCVPFLVILLLRRLSAALTRVFYASRDRQPEPSVMLDTFVHPQSLSPDGAFQDRYFPYLHEYIAEQGLQAAVLPVLHGFRFNYFSIHKRMRRSNTRFILQEDFLQPSDYMAALQYPFKALSKRVAVPSFCGFDVSGIIHHEYASQPLTHRMQASLVYRLCMRLGKAGFKPSLIISWYENQAIDRALIAGARKAFPRARIVGAQLFMHPPNYLSLFPAASEVEAGLAPDLLLEVSAHGCSVAQSFTRSIPCKPAAALRYAHVFQDTQADEPQRDPCAPIVMVLLPFDVPEAIELLQTVREATARMDRDVRIEIKGHPDYDTQRVVRQAGADDGVHTPHIFAGTLPEALRIASVVVSGGSSSMVEAVVKGAPVVFIGREMLLNQNLLAGIETDMATETYSADELCRALKHYLHLTPEERSRYREAGVQLRDRFFEPVNRETLRPFLEPAGENVQPS